MRRKRRKKIWRQPAIGGIMAAQSAHVAHETIGVAKKSLSAGCQYQAGAIGVAALNRIKTRITHGAKRKLAAAALAWRLALHVAKARSSSAQRKRRLKSAERATLQPRIVTAPSASLAGACLQRYIYLGVAAENVGCIGKQRGGWRLAAAAKAAGVLANRRCILAGVIEKAAMALMRKRRRKAINNGESQASDAGGESGIENGVVAEKRQRQLKKKRQHRIGENERISGISAAASRNINGEKAAISHRGINGGIVAKINEALAKESVSAYGRHRK